MHTSDEDWGFLRFLLDEQLYIVPEAAPQKTTPTAEVLVLHEHALGAGEQDLLQKILAAVGLSTDKVALALLSAYKSTMLEHYTKLLIFTDQSPPRDFSFAEKYLPTPAAGKGFFLLSDRLPALEKDIVKKKQLWQALKQMF
jgi:DNA polymerase III psi subunit